MEGTLEKTGIEDVMDVEVSDLDGQQNLEFKGMDPSTTIGELVAMSVSQMILPPDVDWQLRDHRTARVLRSDQALREVARDRRAQLTLQADAILGALG